MKNTEQTNDNPDNGKTAYGLDRYAWNQGYNAKYDFQVFENEEPALVARGGQPYVAESPWLIYQDKIGALCATDHKWVQQEQVVQNKLILQKRR